MVVVAIACYYQVVMLYHNLCQTQFVAEACDQNLYQHTYNLCHECISWAGTNSPPTACLLDILAETNVCCFGKK